jgi:hypothetical protein
MTDTFSSLPFTRWGEQPSLLGAGGRNVNAGPDYYWTASSPRPERPERIPLRLKALFLSLLVSCLAQDAAAQTRPSTVPVPPGSRVRVKTPNLVAPLVANFLEQRGDTLVFIEDGLGRGLWSFSIGQIERLEMTAGEAAVNKAPIAKSAAIGAGVGLVLGVLFASVADPSDDSKKYSAFLTGALGAGVGAGVGAIVGSRIKSERWVTVPLPRQLSLRLSGQGLAVSVPLPGLR